MSDDKITDRAPTSNTGSGFASSTNNDLAVEHVDSRNGNSDDFSSSSTVNGAGESVKARSADVPVEPAQSKDGFQESTHQNAKNEQNEPENASHQSPETYTSVACRLESKHPMCCTHAERIFSFDPLVSTIRSNNFLKGCKWAPDGLCLLTCSDDNVLRLFNFDPEQYVKSSQETVHRGDTGATSENASTMCDRAESVIPEMRCDLRMGEGELIYDYCWYPFMTSYDPTTCCLLSSSRDHPVHMWDAFTGKIRCTYRPYNHLDEITSAYSVTFSNTGSQIYMGFKECVRVFDVARPGRMCQSRPCSKDGQKGILSCIACAPHDEKIYACGSYAKSIGLYDGTARQPGRPWGLLDTAAGVTQVAFSPDGQLLYSGCRQTGDIQCWDLRNTVRVLHVYERQLATNQRLQFDISPDGNHLVSGTQGGDVVVFDTKTKTPELGGTATPTTAFHASDSCINGVSLHPSLPVLATASGQRVFTPKRIRRSHSSSDDDDSDDADAVSRGDSIENSVKVWCYPHVAPSDTRC
eukprot:m.832213 g.832213  ORF g.832213 m.832213 type:complete len:524 (+) comp23435_c0_seq5:217-1788(+)